MQYKKLDREETSSKFIIGTESCNKFLEIANLELAAQAFSYYLLKSLIYIYIWYMSSS